MAARDCFDRKIAKGKVSRRAGEALNARLDELERQNGSDPVAARDAALKAAAEAERAAARKADLARRTVLAQAEALRRNKDYAGHRATLAAAGKAPLKLKDEETPTFAAFAAMMTRDPHELARGNNVEMLEIDVRGRAHAAIAATLERLRPKRLGLKRETLLEEDLLRAAKGENSSQAARDDFAAFTKAFDDLGDQFRAAGGQLAKRENYFPNPAFDSTKVKGRAETFKAMVREHIDRDRLIDFDTDAPMDDARFEQLLDESYERIAADGVEGPPSATPPGRKMLANSRDAARVFEWKSAESWLAIAREFGTHASPFQAALDHIAGLSRDIALLRLLGPNPAGMLRFMQHQIELDAAAAQPKTADPVGAVRQNRAVKSRSRGQVKALQNIYDEVSGANRIPVYTRAAERFGAARALLVASELGGAIISSISDPVTALMASRFNGTPMGRFLGTATQLMAMKGGEAYAARMGVAADSLARMAGIDDQVMGQTIRTGFAAKAADVVIRAQGLRLWTAKLRAAFALDQMGDAAEKAGMAWGDLDPDYRDSLDRYGIGPAEWDVIREATPYQPRPGATFIRPLDIADRAVSEKWAQRINTEMNFAVIDKDARTRAMLVGESRPGTIGGELRASVGLFRTFSATAMMMYGGRAVARGWDGRRASHAAITIATMTLAGAVAMQAKQILAGKDPRPLDASPEGLRSWGAAMLQGGGLGIFGDFFFADQTRFGHGIAETLAGPLVAAGQDIILDTIVKNAQLAAQGKGNLSHFLGDVLFAAGRYAPGTSLFYARLALQREVLDQLALMIDDRAPARFRRIERETAKQSGQAPWWRAGQRLPDRAPNLGAVVGQR